jgi:hypothetical protein
MFCPSVAGSCITLTYLTSYWTANRAMIEGICNEFLSKYYTVLSKSRCALRLRYVDLVASNEVAVEVCCCFIVFSC